MGMGMGMGMGLTAEGCSLYLICFLFRCKRRPTSSSATCAEGSSTVGPASTPTTRLTRGNVLSRVPSVERLSPLKGTATPICEFTPVNVPTNARTVKSVSPSTANSSSTSDDTRGRNRMCALTVTRDLLAQRCSRFT